MYFIHHNFIVLFGYSIFYSYQHNPNLIVYRILRKHFSWHLMFVAATIGVNFCIYEQNMSHV